eukprot:TRINITY_DN9587_c0_g1_i1.p1 TRINITY_DN9587_c0_g1~~TRINITY_DN9587_c0_g1_i1.p1  ORF type:complete len:885 (+),score=266.90 TRINITY_DN9587_c0_g1_i1:65-2719(+)
MRALRCVALLALLSAVGCSSSAGPTAGPSASPSAGPAAPTKAPEPSPTKAPVVPPSKAPNKPPTSAPTSGPEKAPTRGPAAPGAPTVSPHDAPTAAPQKGPAPTKGPTKAPQPAPTKAPETPGGPTRAPHPAPTKAPETPGAPTKAPHVPAHDTPTKAPHVPAHDTPTGSPAVHHTAPPSHPTHRSVDPCPSYNESKLCTADKQCAWKTGSCKHKDPCFLRSEAACVKCVWKGGECHGDGAHTEDTGHTHQRRGRGLRWTRRKWRELDHGAPHDNDDNHTASNESEVICHSEAAVDYCNDCMWDSMRGSCTKVAAEATHTEEESDEAQAIDLWVVSVVLLAAFATVRMVQVLNWSGLSESAGVILCGIAIGGIVELIDKAASHDGRYKEQVAFDEEVFAYFILPPIIFEAGYTLQHGGIMRNLGTILLYAVCGTLISTLVIGLLTWQAAKEWFPELYELDGAMFASIAFGALLSAVDPVAVIAVLSSKFNLDGEPPLLYNLVFGESVLNDAVSIVVFNVMIDFVDQAVTFGSFMLAILTFIKVSLLSCCIGWSFGAGSALFLKHMDFTHHPPVEVIIMMVFAMSGYYFAEAFHLSGIMSIFLCARIMGHHTWHNLSEYSKDNTVYIFKTMAHLAETAVFVLLGMSFWTVGHDFRVAFTIVVFVVMLFSRALNIFPLSWIANRFRKPKSASSGHDGKVTMQMQGFMWFGGLRGAIAFGLALIVHERAKEDDKEHPHELTKHITEEVATVMMSTTLAMVIVTVLVMGGFTEKVLVALKLIGDEKPERASEFLSDEERAEAEEGNVAASRACMRRMGRWESRTVGPFLRVAPTAAKAAEARAQGFSEGFVPMDPLRNTFDHRNASMVDTEMKPQSGGGGGDDMDMAE